TRNYRAALQLGPDYAKALNNPGDNPESFFQLGVALGQLGRTREAAAQYREALRLNPDLAEALNNLAWILAASSEAGLRNGAGAVRLAERACGLTHYGDPLFIRTLADAYAEDGQFAYAVAAAQKACDVALANGQKEIAEGNEQLLKLLKSGRAYHEESKPTP
ncbi:MAG: tetratricopeptide repeat protein, partial [Verrucomicrobiia bacterium]